VKFNQRFRALFSGGTRALFNGSVRALSNPRARRLVGRNRPMLVFLGLAAVAIGLAVPLAGGPQKTYQNLRAQTPQQTAPNSAASATTVPQSTSTKSGSGGGFAAGVAAAANPSAAAPSSASASGASTPSIPTSVSSDSVSSGAVSPAPSSGGASQPSAPAPSPTFNSTNHAKAKPKPRPVKLNLTVGVSDNGPYMFQTGLFLRLHVPTARLVIPWNVAVMRDKTQLNATRKWVHYAQVDHVTPMISFAGNGNYIPSVPVYTGAIKAFLHDFPQVKTYTPWNEPDWIYRPALANNPRLAASYFNTLAFWCHRCTIVAGDVYRPVSQNLAGWVRTYARALHARPKAWAIHPYDDIRAHTTSQIRALESVTSGAIWLTEISGVERRGHCGCPNLSPARANVDERFLFSLPKRDHRIQRLYHYQFQATLASPWDSGLLGPQGKARPAYWTFANALKGKLP
jgi:hypothetical protein